MPPIAGRRALQKSAPVARLRCADAGIGVSIAVRGSVAVIVDADDAPDVIPAVRRFMAWRRCDAIAAARGLSCNPLAGI